MVRPKSQKSWFFKQKAKFSNAHFLSEMKVFHFLVAIREHSKVVLLYFLELKCVCFNDKAISFVRSEKKLRIEKIKNWKIPKFCQNFNFDQDGQNFHMSLIQKNRLYAQKSTFCDTKV